MFMSHGPSHGKPAIFERYEAADEFLRAKDTDCYQFGRQNGWLERVDNLAGGDLRAIGLRYHSTHVVTLWSNGDTEFDTGNWYTNSTAAWMRANRRHDVHLYQCRSGERKKFCYSTIRFSGHDRKIEQQLRDEWGMPTFAEKPHIWEDSFRQYVKLAEPGYGELGVTHTFVATDPILNERAQYFRRELARRQTARHPYYVYEDGITFTRRGRCTNGTLLRDAIEKEKAEREEVKAERRTKFAKITRETNRTFKLLISDGIPVDSEDGQRLRAAIPPYADPRFWLNYHERDDEFRMGEPAPLVQPIIRKRLRAKLADELAVPSLD